MLHIRLLVLETRGVALGQVQLIEEKARWRPELREELRAACTWLLSVGAEGCAVAGAGWAAPRCKFVGS